MKLHLFHSSPGLSLILALKDIAIDARRMIEAGPGGREADRGKAERIDHRNARAPASPPGEVPQWLARLGRQVRSRCHDRGPDQAAVPECEEGRGPRREEVALFGLLWRWERRDGPIERGNDIFSRITPPVACCPDCQRPLRVAPERSRAVYRPVWPAIFTCPCGFFKGFRQLPGEIEAAAYREIVGEGQLAFEVDQLGDEADLEV